MMEKNVAPISSLKFIRDKNLIDANLKSNLVNV
jgi:hypothetical protein